MLLLRVVCFISFFIVSAPVLAGLERTDVERRYYVDDTVCVRITEPPTDPLEVSIGNDCQSAKVAEIKKLIVNRVVQESQTDGKETSLGPELTEAWIHVLTPEGRFEIIYYRFAGYEGWPGQLSLGNRVFSQLPVISRGK